MIEKEFDLTILGSGPGGYVAAIRAAQLGLRVALVERDKLGGVCLNWGCIPSKALLKSAELYNSIKKAGEFGITCSDVGYDFQKIIKRSRDVAERIGKGVEFLMKKNKIEVFNGTGKLLDKHTVTLSIDGVEETIIHSKHLIVATGARPRAIPGIQFDGTKIISSREAMSMPAQPASMAILGAGAIGIEFAYFYNSLGTKVSVIEMLPSILPKEDLEVTKLLALSLKKSGIELHTSTKVENVDVGEKVAVKVSSPEGSKTIEADVALMAVGVQGNIEHLGFEQAGIEIVRGYIKVDEFGKTSVDNIYAIGDVTGAPWLAHVASHQGIIAAERIAGKNSKPIDRNSIPSCTYCQPQVASIGLTEEDAAKAGKNVNIGRFPFRPLGKAVAIGEIEGMVKLIFDAETDRLLGAHIIGSEATEMIAELGLAMKLKATSEDILHTIHAHPTLSEAVMEAAGQSHNIAIHL